MKDKWFKILFVSSDKYPPFRVDVAVLFGKEMVLKGHEIDWVLQSEKDCKVSYRKKWDGGEVWVGPTNNGKSINKRMFKHLNGFIHNCKHVKLLFTKDYDVVQVKDLFFTAILYYIASRMAGVKFIYWLSYPFPEASLYLYETGKARYPFIYLVRGIIYKIILYKFIMKHADHIFVQSEKMKMDVASNSVDELKMTAIPMGIDLKDFNIEPISKKKYAKESDNVIIYIGTLNRIRRIDFLIRVFKLVLANLPDTILYLVGKADSKKDIELLKKEAISLGISEKIIFTGFMKRQNALEIAKVADVCVSPFYPTPVLNSTSPTKLIEYMALGKAVVGNDHPEQRLVIENSGGGICVPYEEKDFAKAIIYLLTHPDINKKMGILGKNWVLKNRAYNIIANDVEETYQKVIENS